MMGKGFYCEDLDDMEPGPKLDMIAGEPSELMKKIVKEIEAQASKFIGEKAEKYKGIPLLKKGDGLKMDDIVCAQPMIGPTMLQFGEMKLSEDGTKYIIPIKFKPPWVPQHIMLNLLREEPEQLEFPFVAELRV